jgi:hypothetical protein
MKKSLFVICLSVLFVSCKNDETILSNPDLDGKWDFVKAIRNGKETKTLSSGYFEFDESTNMIESNIFQVPEDKVYSIEDNTIKIKGQESYDLNIVRLEGDTMHLKGNIWKFKMEFLLVRRDSTNLPIEEDSNSE